MTENHNPKITANWREVAGQPAPVWSRLWARLLQKKGEAPPAADNCNAPKGDEGEKGEPL